MPEGEKEKGIMPGEKDPTERPHHPEAPSQPGKLPGEIEVGERKATTEEFYEALAGLPRQLRQKALGLRRQFVRALKAEDRGWASHILGEMDDLVEQDPRAKEAGRLMDEEFAGEAKLGRPSEAPKGQERRKEPPAEEAKPEEIRKVPDKIDQTRTEEDPEVLADPRSEKMKFVEGRYLLWQEEVKRGIDEIGGQYLRFLAGIGARQPVPGQGITGREWEDIARYTGEIDATIRKIGEKEAAKRTGEEKETLEKAVRLKRIASAYYHELEYYHRFWYGDLEGIGKSTYRPKEGSRLLLVDQMAVLFTIPEVVEAFKEEKGYKSDADLIDEVNDPYGWRRLGHHLRRYSCTPMYRDAYEAGIKRRTKEGEPVKPGFGQSYEYSLYGLYFTGDWAKANNPVNADLLKVRDRDGKVVRDLGEMGATFDMWTTPSRWELYLLFWDKLGKRNQIRLSARRKWLNENPDQLLPKRPSEVIRDLLWKYRDREGVLSEKEELGQLSDREREELQKIREDQEKLVRFSDDEIRELQELLKRKLFGPGLEEEEEARLAEFEMVVVKNMVNRDLGFDPSEKDFDMIGIFSDPLSWHDKITPNDMLTNILVDVRRMEQTKNSLADPEESFISEPTFDQINKMETGLYAHLAGVLVFLKEREIDALREKVTRQQVAGLVSVVNTSGSSRFGDESKKIYDTLRGWVHSGLYARDLKNLYGIDFTDPRLGMDGASLELILDKLIQVHGEGNLETIYDNPEWRWFKDVFDNREEAASFSKEQFMARFGFNSYETFERNIIEEPILNAMGATRGERVDTKLRERERGRNLWLAKKGQLPGDKGVFLASRDQKLRTTERFGGRRRGGGRWIEGWWYETGKMEKVGYLDNDGVYRRTIVWEDPVQRNIFGIEQLIYTRNAEIVSKFLDDHSPDLIDDPNEWMTPPQRQNYIRGQEREIAIDPDRANFLLTKYNCTDGDNTWWTVKRYLFSHIAPEFAQKIPIVGPFAKNVNLAGFGAAGPLAALAGVGLTTFGPLAGIPIAGWTVTALMYAGLSTFVTGPIVRRIARMPRLPFWGKGPGWLTDGLKLPLYYEPGGKAKEYPG